jgi:hypothetical protein
VDQYLSEEDTLYMCEIQEHKETTTNADDPRAQPLLKEYQDVFPEELPAMLPPKRNIDHHIKLVPDSSPPW